MDDLWQIALKIGLSALLAGVIGAEREWTGKWAGLRTHMLIAVGAALLTDVSVGIGGRFGAGSSAWDPGRIAAQIVSGVGFLGAGTILQARGQVHGLTTAAGLWVAAAIGLAVGAEYYLEAAVTSGVLLVILVALRPVERRLFPGDHQEVLLGLGPEGDLRDVSALLAEAELEVDHLKVTETGGGTSVALRFRGSRSDRRRLAALAAERGLTIADERPRPGRRPPTS